MDLLVSPPKPGEASYDLWKTETTTTLNNLKERSQFMAERFNALPGMSCQPADGAMYLFPQIDMPKRAIEEGKKQGKEADVMYALELLGGSTSPFNVYPGRLAPGCLLQDRPLLCDYLMGLL